MKKVSTLISDQYKWPTQTSKRKTNVFTTAEQMKTTGLYVHIESCLIPHSLQKSEVQVDDKFKVTKFLPH